MFQKVCEVGLEWYQNGLWWKGFVEQISLKPGMKK